MKRDYFFEIENKKKLMEEELHKLFHLVLTEDNNNELIKVRKDLIKFAKRNSKIKEKFKGKKTILTSNESHHSQLLNSVPKLKHEVLDCEIKLMEFNHKILRLVGSLDKENTPEFAINELNSLLVIIAKENTKFAGSQFKIGEKNHVQKFVKDLYKKSGDLEKDILLIDEYLEVLRRLNHIDRQILGIYKSSNLPLTLDDLAFLTLPPNTRKEISKKINYINSIATLIF